MFSFIILLKEVSCPTCASGMFVVYIYYSETIVVFKFRHVVPRVLFGVLPCNAKAKSFRIRGFEYAVPDCGKQFRVSVRGDLNEDCFFFLRDVWCDDHNSLFKLFTNLSMFSKYKS